MYVILVASIIIQVTAAILALSYIRKSPGIAWMFIAIALMLMAIRRLLSLIGYPPATILPEVITLVISLLMLAGVLFICDIFKEHRENVVHLKSMHDIDRAILSSLSDRGTMNAIMDKLEQAINPDAIGVYTFDKNGQKLNVLTGYNLSERFQKQVISEDNGLMLSIIKNRKPLILNKIGNDDNVGFLADLRQEGFTAYMGAPIIAQGGVTVGILSLYSKRPRKYVKKDIEFINGIGRQIGIALDRGQFIQRIREMNFESVLALVQAIELRDPYTRGHSLQVANLSVTIAREMGFTEREVELIKFAGLLHDVGKIAVPETILQKPASLTEQEWEIIKLHPQKSAVIIEPIKGLQQVRNWILHHHERWDGAGYPKKLKAEYIPLQARILSVSDTYSAMIGDRPYRKGLGDEKAREEIQRVSGAQLDSLVVDVFLNINRSELKKCLPEGLKR